MEKLHFETIDSTSTYLKRNYENLPNLTFVSADYQTNGHGRNQRTWVSQKDENLLFSLLIKDKNIIKDFSSLSIKAAISIIKVLEDIYHIPNVSLKWPNDVYINDKKVCGILLESVSIEQDIPCIIVGIGLNVNSTRFEGDYIVSPTSLQVELNRPLEIDVLKEYIYQSLLKEIDNNDFIEFARAHNYLKNKIAMSNIGEVKILDIDDECQLLVEIDNKIKHLNTGEITFHITKTK